MDADNHSRDKALRPYRLAEMTGNHCLQSPAAPRSTLAFRLLTPLRLTVANHLAINSLNIIRQKGSFRPPFSALLPCV